LNLQPGPWKPKKVTAHLAVCCQAPLMAITRLTVRQRLLTEGDLYRQTTIF